MSRLILLAAAAFVLPGGAPAAGVHVTADPACTVIRILPNGRRIVTPPRERYRPGFARSATAMATGAGAASSSVSVSASSGGSGHASAASTSGGRGAKVTTTHDDNGCTVTIDRRRGARR